MERTTRELDGVAPRPELFIISSADVPETPLRELSTEQVESLFHQMSAEVNRAGQEISAWMAKHAHAIRFTAAAQFELERRQVELTTSN